MNCLIVDDELLAQDLLALYISRVDFLTLAGRCDNALQVLSALRKTPVDIMFLDIRMPELNGLDLLKSLKDPPKVIVTTAYDEYALEGYELDVVDYLLKPVRFERFMKAIGKVQQLNNPSPVLATMPKDIDVPFYVHSERRLIRIDPQEVRYIESFRNYLVIHAGNQKITVYGSLSGIEEELQPNPYFIQVHKSYIVNTRYVAELGSAMIYLKDRTEIPIGGSYKDLLINALRIFNA